VTGKRLASYAPGHQQFDYPAHSIRVLSGPRTITVAPGAQTGLFSNETGVGRLDAHSYRPNEFFANNWVYDGLVEYGAGGKALPALATSWSVVDRSDQDGQEYTFELREGVEFSDGAAWNCSVAKLNFDHVLAPPLTTADYHGWYGLPGQIDGWSCADNYTLVLTTKEFYYPLLQELSFIRPLRMMSPNMFVGGLDSDPLTQNSCPTGWGNVTDSGVTVNCAGIVGGGVSEGGTVSGTGRWIYDKAVKNDDGSIKEVHFTINEDHWDAPSGNHATRMVVVSYPSHDAVKAALLEGSLDAVMGAGVLTETDIAELKRDHADKLDVALSEAIQNRIVVLNTGKAPTDELQVRKIIIHAVDKTAIIKKELAGLAETADSLFPKDAPYSSAVLTPIPDYDFEKAKLLNCPKASSGSNGLSSGAIAAIAVLGTLAGAGLIGVLFMYKREKAGDPVFQPLVSSEEGGVEIEAQ
jgi:nickel transport system substrate-binding protein